MSDPQVKQFRQRLRTIDKIHRRGGGFEAEGTLGQSYYTRLKRRSSRPVLKPALAILGFIILFKALSAASMSPETYDARLDEMRQGTVLAQAGALVLAPDPVSRALADLMTPYLSQAPVASAAPATTPGDVTAPAPAAGE